MNPVQSLSIDLPATVPMSAAGRVVVGRTGVRALRRMRHAPLAGLALLMMLPTASCVPATSARSIATTAAAPAAIDPATVAAIVSFTAPPTTEVAPPTLAAIVATGNFVPGTTPALNAAIPFTGGPNPAANPFFHRAGADAQSRALQCMTEVIYYEAASESDDGQRAVAQVVLNRMRHPAYPASVCGVVYQNAHRWLACQFSFACDGARARVPSASGWARARAIAAQALAGRVYAPVGTATHYHTWNVLPHWGRVLEKSAVVGAHIFYRLNGAAGRGGAFHQRYAGVEPAAVPFRLPAPATPMLAFAPIALEKTAGLGTSSVRTDAVPLAAPEVLTVPKPVPSPIMVAVEGSTVREEFANSGTIRPEFLKAPERAAKP